MRIVLATQSLAGLGGSETYVVTVADHLQRLGHDVWLHALDHGSASDHARSLGLRLAEGEHELPQEPDALVVQDSVVAPLLALRYPRTPQVFVAHSDIFDLQLPLQLPDLTAAVVTLYDRVDRRIRALAAGHRILRLSQPIDVERFKPRAILPPRPRAALTFGNYVHGTRLGLLERACARAGIELRHVGGYGPRLTSDPAGALNEVDVVFGKARAALEAMACGRAVYVYDHNGAEGWVTDANRALLAADNLGGQSQPIELDEERLVADLALYDPASGLANRDHVIAHNSATKHAAALVGLLREVAVDPRPVAFDAPLRELSRLVRLHARADTQAFLLHAELERRDRRVHELTSEVGDVRHEANLAADAARASAAEAEAARADAAAARAEAEAAQADAAAAREQAAAARAEVARIAAEADDARRRLQTVAGSARWRATQRLLSPLDRARVLAGRHAAPAPARDAPLAPDPAPAPAARRPAAPPVPLVVGVARSGTTLLRLQLDAHPLLAMAPESGFGTVAGPLARAGAGREQLAGALAALAPWPDLGIDEETLRELLAGVDPWSVGDGLRAVFGAYAARHGKPRWGEKTPGHLVHMPDLEAVLPEARFVHIVRDGRDVAASLREQPFAPGDGTLEAAAAQWRDQLAVARASAPALSHYREVRYEQLVDEPEATLRELCDFLELPFAPELLRAHERAAGRLAELPASRLDGDRMTTREERVERHARTATPPDPSRAGRWRHDLTAAEVAAVEAVAGETLTALGYT